MSVPQRPRPSSYATAFLEGAKRFPTACLTFARADQTISLTLPEIAARGIRLAGSLRARGVERGSVVVAQLPNSLESALLNVACAAVGAVYAPVIRILGPAELATIVKDLRAALLVQAADVDNMNTRALDAGGTVVVGAAARDPLSWTAFESLDGDQNVVEDVPIDEVALVLHTSGTSGRPRAVEHCFANLWAEADSTARHAGWDEPATVILNPTTAGHIGATTSVLRPFVVGCSVVFMDRWDPPFALHLIREHHVTALISGAPVILDSLVDLLQENGEGPGSLKECQVGGSAVSPRIIERADSVGIAACRAYGSTEHPTVTACRWDDPLEIRLRSDGRSIGPNRIRILDEEQRELPVGAAGEVATAGPDRSLGYRDRAVQQAHDLGGYLLSGDIGMVDERGYLTITGRKKDTIIRGGENIAAREVEEVLLTIPNVVESAAVGVPDLRLGETVAGFVRLRPGTTLGLDEVRKHFADSGIAKQKTPEHIVILDDFPRTVTGKVVKRDLLSLIDATARNPMGSILEPHHQPDTGTPSPRSR